MEFREVEIKEIYLQALWNEQEFSRQLLSEQGQELEILFPGKWNTGAGPDFLDAHLMIDGQEISGDVEIHFSPSDWKHHGHQDDPRYENVILHAVWQSNNKLDPSGKSLLLMSEVCAMSLNELEEHYRNYSQQAKFKPIEGILEFASLSDKGMSDFLEKMAFLRLSQKCTQLEQQITKYGLEQAIYQKLMEAFGYSRNRQAFLTLAKAAKIEVLKSSGDPEALLWGESGLLQDQSQNEVHEELKAWHQEKWHAWANMRSSFNPEIIWDRKNRPQNTPERRLAGLVLFMKNLNWDLECFLQNLASEIQDLHSYFEGQSVMTSFCHFSKKFSKEMNLVGESRQREIRLNVFYPYLFLRSHEDGAKEAIKKSYLNERKSDDTGLLREAACRFFIPPSRMKVVTKKFVHQQGLYYLLQNPEWLKECTQI